MRGIGLKIKSDTLVAFNSSGERIVPISYGGHKYIVFKSSGQLIVKTPSVIDFLLVAGGGSGGMGSTGSGGGGGAGGVVYKQGMYITQSTYSITIGSGGIAASGGNSSFAGYISYGGGLGGSYNQSGSAGGSGGGGGAFQPENYSFSAGGTSLQYNTPSLLGYGNIGGYGYGSNGTTSLYKNSGGGGGAGSSGSDALYDNISGNGGLGLKYFSGLNPLNLSVMYADYYAAGGGGGGTSTSTIGYGGSGIGGNGGTSASSATAGLANTGCGGGGAGSSTASSAGNGGSGICIIRFPIQNIVTRFYKYIKKVIYTTPTTGSFPNLRTSNASDIYKLNSQLNLINSTDVLWCGDMGTLVTNNNISCSFSSDDDLQDIVQNTSAYQPFFAGNIAPNERKSLLKTSRYTSSGRAYISHSAITYGVDKPFTFAFVLNWNGIHSDYGTGRTQITYGGNIDSIGLQYDNNKYFIMNNNTSNLPNGSISPTKNKTTATSVGKQTIYHLVRDASSYMFYRDGILDASTTSTMSFRFSSFPHGYQSSGDNWIFGGKFHYYQLISRDLSANEVYQHYSRLNSYYPEIQYTTINGNQWATSNLDITQNTNNSIIPCITNSFTVQISGDVNWWGISSNLLATKSGTEIFITKSNSSTAYIGLTGGVAFENSNTYKWYKLTFQAKSDTVANTIQIFNINWSPIIAVSNPVLNGAYQNYQFYLKYLSGWSIIYASSTIPTIGNSIAFKDMTLSQVGWSDMQTIYQTLINSGSYNSSSAITHSAAWCYYNNDPTTYALYGKLYNRFAAMLIQSYPPTASGKTFNLPSLTGSALNNLRSTYSAHSLKTTAYGYWSSSYGDNSTTFSAVGSGYRAADGTFKQITQSAVFWAKSIYTNSVYTNYGFKLLDSSTRIDTTSIASTEGYSIRLVNIDTPQTYSNVIQSNMTNRQSIFQSIITINNLLNSYTESTITMSLNDSTLLSTLYNVLKNR